MTWSEGTMRSRAGKVVVVLGMAWIGAIARVACAQSASRSIGDVRAPEVFVHFGAFRAGSDEGPIGTGASYGGGIALPIARRIAVAVDVQTSRVFRPTRGPTDWYRTRRSLLIPSVLYRFGDAALYGYVGGGLGAEFDSSTYHMDIRSQRRGPGSTIQAPGPDWREIEPGVFEVRQSESGGLPLSALGGFAAFPWRRLGLRGDVFMAGWHLGARIGVAYRFE
jgi:hypothetical protein